MVGHGGSSAGSYLADPTSPIPSHCASIVVTSTVRVNICEWQDADMHLRNFVYFKCGLQENSKKKEFSIIVILREGERQSGGDRERKWGLGGGGREWREKGQEKFM